MGDTTKIKIQKKTVMQLIQTGTKQRLLTLIVQSITFFKLATKEIL